MANTKITTNVIADDAITTAKIADDAVGNDQLASGLTLGGNTAATLSTAAQPNITSLGTLTTLTVDDITINGSTISDASDLTFDVGGGIVLDADDSGTISFKDGGTRYGIVQKASNNFEIQSMISDGDLVIKGNDGGSTITALTLDMSDAGAAKFTGKVNVGGTTMSELLNVQTGSSSATAMVEFRNTQAGTQIGMPANTNALTFQTADTERLRIDSSGRLLKGTAVTARQTSGVTSSTQIHGTGYNDASLTLVGDMGANALTAPVLFFAKTRGSAGASTSVSSGDRLGAIFFNGADGTDINTVAASIDAVVDDTPGSDDMPGRLTFRTSADGSGSNAERMRIDSNGNVGIGSSVSPTRRLDVRAGSGAGTHTHAIFTGTASRGLEIRTRSDTSGGQHSGTAEINSADAEGTGGDLALSSNSNIRLFIDGAGHMGFNTTSIQTFNNYTSYHFTPNGTTSTALLVDDSTGSSGRLQIFMAGSGYFGTRSNDDLIFTTNDSGRMRIKANGVFIHGKSTDDVDTIGWIVSTNGSVYSSTNSSNNSYHYRDTTNTRYNFYVGGNGQVNARFTGIAQISDGRLKENVRDYTVGLNDILKLKPRVFDWKEKEGEKDQVGFIAQEFEEVFPDWIGNFLHDDLDDAKSVSAGEIIYPMVNAIKELKAEIDALKEKLNG